MSEKEYIVSLNKGVDYEAFNQEMIATTGAGDIPGRSVDVANARPGSLRNTHYMLTDEEAAALNNDARVYAVELRPDLRDDIEIGHFATQVGDFSKTVLDRGDYINWGLVRANSSTDPYQGSNASIDYNYTLDASGVDIVIQDSGIQADHPDFFDYEGNSRVQQINWFAESGLPGTQSTNHYRDYDGHGTHVAGIAAGLTYGWAKNARIYSVKVNGLEGSGDSNTGISVSDCFDVIKEWHNNKPVDPATGVKRPTIVNMSWGYGRYFSNITGGNYRGTPWTGTARDTTKGMVGVFTGIGYRHVVRVASVDVDLEELIDAGVHVCIAAGNSYQKIDVPSGLDYDNYYTDSIFGNIYYHRGGSPYSENAIVVGNADSAVTGSGVEQSAASSEKGPGVTLWAPGTNIMSTTSTVNSWGINDGPYPSDEDFLITNISGTSMASPQVAGIVALYCQLNPNATPAQAKAYVSNNAVSDKLYTTNLDNDYGTSRSLLGGPNKYAFNKFNSATQMTIGQTTQATALIPATYGLSTSVGSVNEGQSFTITLTTTNIADGTSIPYTITGVDSDDLSGASLTGNFAIQSGTSSIDFNVAADATTEGNETFTLTLDHVNELIQVTIVDSSTTPVPTYSLDTGGIASINEGSDLTITLTTTFVDDGTQVPYTISGTGITTADIGGNSLTGSFTVNNNTATLILPITSDATTEGLETLTLRLNNNADAVNVTINDTSGAGNVSYTLSADNTTPNEGDTVTVTLTTTNVVDSTIVPYTISGTGITTADIGGDPLTGSFTVTGNTATMSFTLAEDLTTEASETLTLSLNNGGDSIDIVINDTSTTPLPTYTLSADTTNINEGDTVTITLTTTNVSDATSVAYTVTGIDANDLTAGSLTGNFTISSNTDSISFTLSEDLATENTETLTLALDNGQDSIAITVNDTSTAPAATYALSSDVANVNEGGTVVFTLTTTNVADATNLAYTVTGIDANDLSAGTLTGNFTVTSNTATVSFTLAEDATTEGAETMTLALDNGQATHQVTVNDTSLTQAADYTITVSAADSTNYSLSGNDRNGAVSGTDPALTFNVGDIIDFSVSAPAHPFWIKTTQNTGTGDGASGVTNNGAGSGTVRWVVPSTGTYYYICQFHAAMTNTITVSA